MGAPKIGHDAVAEELVHDPVVLRGRVDHQRVEVVEHADDLLGRQPLGQGRESPHVAEEDRDVPALLFQGELLRILQDLVDHLAGDVARERPLDHLLLAKVLRHLVERLGQRADLVPRGNRQVDLEVPGGDGARALDQAHHGPREHGGQPEGPDDPDDDHGGADDDRRVPRGGDRLVDRLPAEAEVQGADRHPAEDQGHREVDHLAVLRIDVRRDLRLAHRHRAGRRTAEPAGRSARGPDAPPPCRRRPRRSRRRRRDPSWRPAPAGTASGRRSRGSDSSTRSRGPARSCGHACPSRS